MATLKAGRPGSSMPLSKTAPRPRRARRLQEVDDRVAAGLLLPVAGEAHVDRQLAGGGETPRGLEQHEELPLVVGDASRVEPAVALVELERRRVPELERVGRLHVEVAVAEDGRGASPRPERPAPRRSERLPLPVDESAVTAGARMRSQTHSAARATSAACSGSALIEGIAISSASWLEQRLGVLGHGRGV